MEPGPVGSEVGAGELAPGALLAGRYRVLLELGRGANGTVYAVHDQTADRRVALKLSTPAGRAALERELHTLSGISHPSIIEVFDYGLHEGAPFYTMELLDGQDLRERGRLPWNEAAALLRDVASSLAILHSRGLLHRDVSARNVRCTADGRAKLIDFGAMVRMGRAHALVGTPPFVPPEALQLQTLDARADLYALGALAYAMLTGQHAYPARSFEQLADLFRSPPAELRKLAPDVPVALEQLVMDLLCLDRDARPSSAAQVMEQLSGVAGLPLGEQVEVSRAYLVTPTLVGRELPLARARALLARLSSDHGGALLLEGAPGSGRSRMLDACVLESKLLGARVLRADASDGASGEYGAIAALLRQLMAALPEQTLRFAAPQAQLLSFVLPELATANSTTAHSTATATTPQRRHVQAALRDVLLAVSRKERLVIAVDDFDGIDEPSAAVLAALAHAAHRRKLALLASAEEDSTSTAPALEVLRERAQRLSLPPLSADETGSLLRSVFGDVERITPLALRIFELSEGNPGRTMDLARELLSRGIARYEAGAFSLPAELGPEQLPRSIAEAVRTRIDALPKDARELAEALALTDATTLPADRYPLLTSHQDPTRTFRALEQLLMQNVLRASGERYRLSQRKVVTSLTAALSPERTRALHERLSHAHEGSDDPIAVAFHAFYAGKELWAIERLLSLREDTRIALPSHVLPLLEQAAALEQARALPLRQQVDLKVWVIDLAAALGDYAIFARHAFALLEQLERDSGIADYRELFDLEAPARLTEALARAHARSQAQSDVLPPTEAIPLLARVCSIFGSMASVAQDAPLLSRLPSLEPLTPLSPSLSVVHLAMQAMCDFEAGRFDAAKQKSLEVIDRVSQPDRADLPPSYHKAVYLGHLYLQGVLASVSGQPTTPAWLAALEQEPGHRMNAWRVRMTHELMHGNVEAAQACLRRAELLHLQDGGRLIFPGSTARLELLAYIYADDLLGVKRMMERIELLAARYPRWGIARSIARAHYMRLRGDMQGGLREIESVMAEIAPGEHIDWALAANTHVRLLRLAGRAEDAASLGERYLELSEAHALSPNHRGLLRSTAEAHAARGEIARATELASRLVSENEQLAIRGLGAGLAYETQAAVAIAAHDPDTYRTAASNAAREYQRGKNPALLARIERLAKLAEQAGLEVAAASQASRLDAPEPSPAEIRLRACRDEASRAREILALLLETTSARGGVLLGWRDGGVRVLCSTDAHAPSSELLANGAGYLRKLLDATGTETAAASEEVTTASLLQLGGRALAPILIIGGHDGETSIAALALLEPGGKPLTLPAGLLELLGTALLEADDVDALTCVA